jgi:putative copper resistance protein D
MPNDLQIVVRAIHFASTAMVGGVIFFMFFVGEPALRGVRGESSPTVAGLRTWLRWTAWTSLAATIISGAGWLVLLAAGISGRPLAEVVPEGVVSTLLVSTQFGQVWLIRLGIATLLTGWLVRFRPEHGWHSLWQGAILVSLAAGLLGSLGWAGHAGATAGFSGDVHVAADVMHLIAAGAWIGGLLPLALLFVLARQNADDTWAAVTCDATRRFSVLGLASVGTLLVTGIANTWFLAGTVPSLVGTNYGRLLLLKIGLFIAMVCIAAVNRRRLTPQLVPQGERSRSRNASRRLQRNSLIELGLGLVIIVIVGALGTIPPALHVQPQWPFPVRFNEQVFDAVELRTKVIVSIVAIAAGTLLILGSMLVRRLRWPMIAVSILISAFFARSLNLVVVEAFPTSFYSSPTGYSARTIAQGKALFAEHCSACHGPKGLAETPTSQDQKMPPDLTGDHIYSHRDGDLFWWITNGIEDGMPGFAEVLDEDARWNLIDFIHANADAPRFRTLDARQTSVGFQMPNFSADCPDGSVLSIDQLRGRIVHLVFASTQSRERVRQLAAIEPATDVIRIVAALDASVAEDVPLCVARDPEVVVAFSLYRGGAVEAMDDTEFLIDAAGLLRSMWYPGSGPGWSEPAALPSRIEEVRRTIASPWSASSHVHGH